jgi:hypothetical protein
VRSNIINFDETKFPVMKICDFPRGPYPTRVRIALAEKNLESRVQFVMVDLYKGEHKKPEFIAQKNYSGTLPVPMTMRRTRSNMPISIPSAWVARCEDATKTAPERIRRGERSPVSLRALLISMSARR